MAIEYYGGPKMNCTYDPNASIGQFLYRTYNFFQEYFTHLDHIENEVETWFLMRLSILEYMGIVLLIFFWKYTREFFMKNISKPCVKRFNVGGRNIRRTKESIWAFTNDVIFWIFVFFLIQKNDEDCNLYYTPSRIHQNLTRALPMRIKIFYFLQISKYSLGIYAVLYLDERRKDFPVMVMHHIVTLTLVTIAYVTGFVDSGLIVLLIHNIPDMILNCAKILLYSRPKTSIGNRLNKIVLWMLATCFTLSWLYNRLYLYPLRAIYYIGSFDPKSPEGRIFGIAFLLLLLIFLMDIYWTWYLAKFLWRLFVYERELFDPVSQEISTKKEMKSNKNHNNNNQTDYKKMH